MGNTVTRSTLTRTVAQNAAASASKHVQSTMHRNQIERRETQRLKSANLAPKNGYANDLRPRELGRAPPVTERTAPRAKQLPSYFGGRDTLEKVREQLRYQSDMDRFRKRVGVPCKNACHHSFCQPEYCSCAAYQRFSLLGKTDQPSVASATQSGKDKTENGGDMRQTYDRESVTLAKQIAVTNKQLAQQRNGSLYDGAQQAVRGANAVARRPVASIEVERAVQKNSSANDDDSSK